MSLVAFVSMPDQINTQFKWLPGPKQFVTKQKQQQPYPGAHCKPSQAGSQSVSETVNQIAQTQNK